MSIMGRISYIVEAKTQPLKDDLKDAKTAMSSADKQMKNSGKAISDSSKKMGKAAGDAIQPMEQGLSAINPAAGQAVAGMRSASMGAKALNAALGPIGIAVGLLAAAIGGLTAYFTQSVEGQQKMAKIMAYLGGIADTVKDAFVDLGKWIVWAFENPQEAIKQLWETIKTNLINRLTGLVDMYVAGFKVISQGAKGVGLAIKGIFSDDAKQESKEAFAEMKQGMEDFGHAALQAVTGVEDVVKKVKEGAKELSDAAKKRAEENMALQERENRLQMQQIENQTKIARLDAEIAAARLIANDETRETADQLAGIERAEELVNEKFAIRQQMASEALAIQRERMALGHDTIQDMEEEARLATELINLEQSRDSEVRNLSRRKTAIANRAKADHEAEKKAIEDTAAAEQAALDDISAAKQAAFEKDQQARAGILEEIRKAGLTEVESLQEAMDKKIALHEWSEAERASITQHYQDKINAILESGNEKQMTLVESLTEAFHDMADTMVDGSIGIGKAFAASAEAGKQATREILDQMLSQIIAVLIQKILSSPALPFPFNVIAAAGAGAIAGGLMGQIPKMADGGIVPPGYPKDTYPALLSSGETVTPPGKLPEGGGDVVLKIHRDELRGILKLDQKYQELF